MYSTPARLAAKPSVSVDGAVKPASQAIDSQPSHRSSAELGRQPQRTVRVGRQPRPRGNTARIINIYEWCARKNSKDGQQWNSYAAQHNRALAEAQNHGHEEVTLSIQGRVYTINLKTLKQTNRQTGSQHDIRPVDIQLHSQQQKCTRLQQPPKTPRQCHVKPLGPNEEHTRNELVSSRPVRRLPPALPAAGRKEYVAATDAGTSSAAGGRCRSRSGHREESPTVSSAATVPRPSSEPTVSPRRESESPPALRAAGSQDHVAATDAATSSAAGGRSRSRSGHREESPTPSCAETVSSPQRETMSPITPHRKDHASITADAEALILKCEKLISENYSSGLLTSQLIR